jgi:hypothetical protein
VLNGHEAEWHLDASHRRPDYAFVWTAQGQGVVSQDVVVHAMRSMQVTPRWPGGQAPVTLSLQVAEGRPTAGAGPGADAEGVRESALRTTVTVPFDAWTAVARLGDEELQVRVRRH